MLTYLAVRNFAIIENIETSFSQGMTVLTGETGAGKSLLIDAIGLLLGDRASSNIIRTGEMFCEVTGLFTAINSQVVQAIKALDIPTDDNECLITRQIHSDSGNIIKINQKPVTLNDLRTITKHLADIHSQHDTKRLINPKTYLALLDSFEHEENHPIIEYLDVRTTYLETYQAYEDLKKLQDESIDTLDFKQYQLEEIDKHELYSGEEKEIDETLQQLQNFDKIHQSLKRAYTVLSQKETAATIYDAAGEIDNIVSYDAYYKSMSERLKSTYYELEDIQNILNQKLNTLDFDEQELERLETRKHTITMLKQKYRRSYEDIIQYREVLQEEIKNITQYDTRLKEKETDLMNVFDRLNEKAICLHEYRKKQAEKIEKALIKALDDLELKETRFRIQFDKTQITNHFNPEPFTETGIDQVDFLLSTNVGEKLGPLSKVASGGELSRIMLALKTVLIDTMRIDLMILDEIDAGVSGFIASQVALKMKQIAQDTQVVAITHLPQVAAKADTHYYIYKQTENKRTKAYIKSLDRNARIQALAEMISSSEVTEHALKSAESLLK